MGHADAIVTNADELAEEKVDKLSEARVEIIVRLSKFENAVE